MPLKLIFFISVILISSQSSLAFLEDVNVNDLDTLESFETEMADTSNDLTSRTGKVNALGSLERGTGNDRFNYDDGAVYDDVDFVRPTRAEKKQKNEEFIRFGRNNQGYLRFGRGFQTPPEYRVDHMKSPTRYFGKHEEINKRRKRDLYHKSRKRAEGSNYMRFGRNPTFMRFGRNMKSILKNLMSKTKIIHHNDVNN